MEPCFWSDNNAAFMDAPTQASVIDHPFAAALLRTKLSMPGVAALPVERPRLLDALGGASLRPLSLVCAPAGFGKTTALVSCLRALAWPVAWVALDELDNDANRFLQYLIAAIQTVQPGLGAFASKSLSSPNPPNPQSLLPGLVNELHAIEQPFVLALDDYHVIESSAVHQLLNFLIEQQPPALHIAMTSRSVPPLPVARMRVGRTLAELGEADLRFTTKEVEQFFRHSAGLNLSDQEVALLARRTEGWAAGMQLVGLSLSDEPDRSAFIQTFAGDHRHIADYLTEEVLKRQSAATRQFLLKTSILERMNGPLCDAVTAGEGSGELLVQLEQSAMFMVPLDQRRHWYRYHHLFAELLQHQLEQQAALGEIDLRQLHRRAGRWFMAADAPEAAMKHALVADDFELALSILERYSQSMFMRGQCALLGQWFERIPLDHLRQVPSQLLQYVWNQYVGFGVLDEVLIEELEAAINSSSVTDEVRSEVSAELQLLQAFRFVQRREWLDAIAVGRDLLASSVQREEYCTAPIHLNLATAWYGAGDIDQALASFAESRRQAIASQTLVCLNGAIGGVASCHLRKGELTQALTVIEQGIQLLEHNGWLEQMTDTAWLYMALGDIAYERNQLEAAAAWFSKAAQLAESDRWDTVAALITMRQARLYYYQGKPARLAKALQRYQRYDIKPALLPLMAAPELDSLALSLRQGEIGWLTAWQQQQGYAAEDKIAAGDEDEYSLYARLLLSQGDAEGAARIADQLRLAARQQGRLGDLIRFTVLYALARQASGQLASAVSAMEEVMAIAEPQDYARCFIDEGPAMALLLAEVARSSSQRSYATRLRQQLEGLPHKPAREKAVVPEAMSLLSKAEIKTLELLAQGLSNRAIAEQAFVSVNTVKTHLKNIYAKLNVDNRVQAIARFRRLQ